MTSLKLVRSSSGNTNLKRQLEYIAELVRQNDELKRRMNYIVELVEMNTRLKEELAQILSDTIRWADHAADTCTYCCNFPTGRIDSSNIASHGLVKLSGDLRVSLGQQQRSSNPYIIATGGAGSSGLPALDKGSRTIKTASRIITTDPAK